ncbi:MAG TPA: hypothetical protein VIJ57_06115, partial [Hanamia sp.]
VTWKLNKYHAGACYDILKEDYINIVLGHPKFTFIEISWNLKFSEEFDMLPQSKKKKLQFK